MTIEQPAEPAPPWVGRFIVWDALFPWIGCLGTWLFDQCGGLNRDAMELLVAIVWPIVICLVRAGIGVRSLPATGVPGQRPGLAGGYHVLFAAGLIVLMIFEMLSALVGFADDAPLSAWGLVLGAYILYVAIMLAVEWIYRRALAESRCRQACAGAARPSVGA